MFQAIFQETYICCEKFGKIVYLSIEFKFLGGCNQLFDGITVWVMCCWGFGKKFGTFVLFLGGWGWMASFDVLLFPNRFLARNVDKLNSTFHSCFRMFDSCILVYLWLAMVDDCQQMFQTASVGDTRSCKLVMSMSSSNWNHLLVRHSFPATL